MRVSTSKSETMVLCWKTVDCSLWVGSELLPQAKEFKYLGVLFTGEGEMDRWIGAAGAVMQGRYQISFGLGMPWNPPGGPGKCCWGEGRLEHFA